jgi:hypothetical protein
MSAILNKPLAIWEFFDPVLLSMVEIEKALLNKVK